MQCVWLRMWQWVYCIFAQTALMVAISPRHVIFCWLRAVSSQNYVIVLMSYERTTNKEKYVPVEKTFIPGTIKRHIFILDCSPKLIQYGIPINFKRQISAWIISIENREERLVGLGKLLGISSEKYVLRLFRISTLFPFIFWGGRIPLFLDAILSHFGHFRVEATYVPRVDFWLLLVSSSYFPEVLFHSFSGSVWIHIVGPI